MQTAPRNLRLHIGIFGRRNVGKSSLLNAVTRQETAIVSAAAGTTTDPVEKSMELPPLGPVLFIDTAGVDDVGALGAQRIEKTRTVYDRADIGVVVAEPDKWGEFEEEIIRELTARTIPAAVVFNKDDLGQPDAALTEKLAARGLQIVHFSAAEKRGIEELKTAFLALAPDSVLNQERILADLVPAGETAVLVIPVDKEAPKGRLILPQVMTLRNLLDHDLNSVVTTVGGLPQALASLQRPPCIVVTDSQAFAAVAAIVPEDIPLTGFSVLFARCLGDLPTQAAGTRAIRTLAAGDKILIAESCSHHPIGEDIGRVKIPHMLRRRTGAELEFTHVQGHDFPADLSPYKLVIMCGGCMNNRREILTRILHCREQNVPVSNYGLTIAECLGIFERAVAPFRLNLPNPG